MFLIWLDSCELNNEFSTKLLDYIRNTQKAMLSLFFLGGGGGGGVKNRNSCNAFQRFEV